MSTQVQFRRGTTSQNNAFTGAAGELTVDTDVWALRIHDGTTAGGKVVPTLTATQTLTNKTLGSNSVWNGSAVGLAYGGTGASLSAVSGAVAYSSGSAIGFSLAGTSGQVLTSGGTSAPTWVNASSIVVGTATAATRATNISGGSAGNLIYQADTDTTSFIASGTTGYVLRSTGASTAPDWVTPNITLGSSTLTLGSTTTAIDGISTFYITGTTDASSSTTGVLRVAGGISTQKKLYVGTDLNVGGNAVVTGNLTVNGTTTTINSTTISVDDKNIELGSVDSPSDTTANGGGITLKGSTDKTLNWVSSTSAWTSSEHLALASGKTILLNGSSSGTTTVQAASAASGTLTLPAATDTLVGKATTDTLTNKTFDTAGTGNSFSINGTGITTVTGTGAVVLAAAPTLTGHPTIEGITSTGATGTGNLVFSASPTFTGHPTIEGVTSTGATGTGNLVFSASPTFTGTVSGISATMVGLGNVTNESKSTMFTSPTFTGTVSGVTATMVGLGNVTNESKSTMFTSPTFTGHATVEGVTATGATGTGKFVFDGSPTLVTPVLGDATVTSINKLTITAPTTSATLTIADGKTLTASNSLTFTGTDLSSVAFGGGGTVAYTSNKLSAFAATSSSELAGIISDETGSGALVFANTPTLVTPVLGVASATSINKVAITAPATGSTLTIADGKTLTTSNTLTFTGNDSSTVNFGSGGTVGYTGSGLNQFASTTSSELASVISDETGSGKLVFGTSPTLTTSIVTDSTTFALLNTTATTINFGGAATTINIGSTSSGSAVNMGKDVYVGGNLYVTGTQTNSGTATVSATDSALYVNTGATGNTTDIGLIGTFVSTGTKYTGVLRDHTDSTWKFYSTSTAPSLGSTQSFVGATYDGVKMGALAASTGAFSGDLTVGSSKFTVTASSGDTAVSGNLTVTGDLTVNGTTTTINSTTISVDDKNIELGSVTSPTNTTADGGGITLKGTTDKTFNWVNATSAWTSSEHLAVAAGKNILINGSSSGTITVAVPSAAGSNTITLPATTGTVVTTGDTGTVTNTMLAGSISNAKLSNSTISGISLGSNLATLTIGSGLSGTSYNGSTGVTIAVDSTVALRADTTYIGTTAVALNRASGNLALTGILSETYVGSTSGTIQLIPSAVAGTGTVITLPATTGTVITTGDSATVTNTMLAGSIANAKLANSSVTFGSTAVSLGSSSTSIAGLTSITFAGSTSGTTQVLSTAIAGTSVLTLPAATDTLVGKATTDTLTNKTISGSSNTLSNIGNSSLTNSSVTVGTTAISLGSSSTTLAGLTSVTSTSFTGALTGNASTATTLQTARAIYGNNFDGSAALTQIIASTYGGTGNGFTKFSGATTAEKTYTLPDATCTILTSNAAVTVAQGGTGQTTYTDGQLLIGNTVGNTLTKATLTAGTAISVTNGNGSISIANTGVTSAVAGTGISVSGATGAVTITNSGVTSVSAGTGVTLGATTGACSISIGQAVATSSNVQFNSIGVNTAGSGTAGEIRATNNITAYYSDARLKNFEGTIPNALDKVLSLNGYYFTENEVAKSLGYNNDARQVGVSAQEVEAIMPEVIADAPINGNFPGADYKTVHYEKLVPLLIEAIKEQQKQIEELKVKLGN